MEKMKLNKITCIYCILDLILDQIIYVGQTTNFNRRKSYHFSDKRSAIDKYMFELGREYFFMAILEELNPECSKEERLIKELKYIDKYTTDKGFGFNKQKSGLISKDKKKYYEANKDKIKEYKNAYSKANKDKIKAYLKVYYEANKDKMKEYYEANKDRIKALTKEYKKANKDKIKEYNKIYYQKHKSSNL